MLDRLVVERGAVIPDLVQQRLGLALVAAPGKREDSDGGSGQGAGRL